MNKQELFTQLKQLNIDIQKHLISGYILTYDNVSIRIRFRKENILIYRGISDFDNLESWSNYILHNDIINLIKKELYMI